MLPFTLRGEEDMYRRGTGWGRLLLLVGLLTLPLAIAAPSTGAFVTRGAVGFTGTTNATFPSAVLYLPDTSRVGISGTFPLARVCEYEWHSQEVSMGSPLFWAPVTKQGPCFDQRNLVLGLILGANNSGWLGIHPRAGGALDFTPSGSANLEPRPSVIIASPESDSVGTNTRQGERENAEQPWFNARSTEAVVVADQSGVAVQRGPAELKIKGADVTMRSDTNTTSYATGDTSADGPVHERIQKWLVITFDVGEVTLTSDASPFQIAAGSATVDFNGTTRFIAASGDFDAGAGKATANDGDTTTIEGSFTATLTPKPAGDALGVSLAGDTRDATLGFVRVAVPVPAAKSAFPWLWFGVGLVALVLVGGVVVAKKKRVRPIAAIRERLRKSTRPVPAPARERLERPQAAPPPPVSAAVPAPLVHAPPGPLSRALALHLDEETDVALSYVKRAKRMAEKGEYAAAVDNMEKARRVKPDVVPHAALLQGVWLYMERRYPQAATVFNDAMKEEKTGEAEFWAASCMVHLADEERAADLLVRALNRSSRFVLLLVEDDEDFRPLRERDDVKAALERAREKHAPRS